MENNSLVYVGIMLHLIFMGYIREKLQPRMPGTHNESMFVDETPLGNIFTPSKTYSLFKIMMMIIYKLYSFMKETNMHFLFLNIAVYTYKLLV